MLRSPRLLPLGLVSLILLVLLGGFMAQPRGAPAQSETPTADTVLAAEECPTPGSAALAATTSPESPYYDYVVLLDVSGSMLGWRGEDPPVYYEELDIFADVKESLKGYVRDLQPGSMVFVIPFGNDIDPDRVRQFGIDEPSAPDGGEAEALDYIDSIEADNDETHITSSIEYALRVLAGLREDDEREHIQTVLLYTDGIGNGDDDVNPETGQFDPRNLIDALREFRQEQPYLFVKYVSLGVEVPGREILEENGVEVLEQAQGVPPVREVRLALVPGNLGAIQPGVPTTNRLCATSGDLGGGITVNVNDDPSALPADVQLAFRASGFSLDVAGLPLTYTLASLPVSGLGPYATYVEVRPEDPTVFLVPSRLPVTFSAATPTRTPVPVGDLHFGQFPEQVIVRGMGDGIVEWPLPIDLESQHGGSVTLRTDPLRLDVMLPEAALGFRAGDGSLVEEIVLTADRPRAVLVLSATQEQLETLADDAQGLPVDVIVDPGATELTIAGATAEPTGNGTWTVPRDAPLVVLPTPTCTVEVGEAPARVVTAAEASTEPVRWEAVVDLDGSGGCQGDVSFDDEALRLAIPGARAMFLVNGEERSELDLGDTRFRATLVVIAPRDAVAGLGIGEHATAVDLIVTPTDSMVELPESAKANDDGTFTISVPVRATVSEQALARCTLPLFDEQEVVLDGATEPPVQWPGNIECSLSGGAIVTLRIIGEDSGASAHFMTDGGQPSRSMTRAEGTPAPTLELEVDRKAVQDRGEGDHEFGIELLFQVEPDTAVLIVDGQTADPNGTLAARVLGPVRVAPGAVITLQPLELAPDPIALETRGSSPDPLGWRGELDYDLLNGAQGKLDFDGSSLPDGAEAFFAVGGVRVPSPVELAGQQGTIELIVRAPLADAQALGAGEQSWTIPIVLDAQGAEVRWPGAARVGSTYQYPAMARMSIMESQTANLTSPKITPTLVSSEVPDVTDIKFAAPIEYELSEGAEITLRVADEGLLQDEIVQLTVDGKPVDGPVPLPDNGQTVGVLVTVPKSVFTEEKTYDLPAGLVVEGDGVYITIDDQEFPPGTEAPLSALIQVNYGIPSAELGLGAWAPEKMEAASTGTGTAPLRVERAVSMVEREDGAQPSITFELDDAPPGHAVRLRLYENQVAADGTPALEESGGQPVSASFTPGTERIIAVLEVPEEQLRAIGITDAHQLACTLTIDPQGAQVRLVGEDEPILEPTDRDCSIQLRIYEPFDLWRYLKVVLAALGALLVAAAIYAFWPVLPRDAAIKFGGRTAALPPGGASLGGPGADFDIGANGPVADIRGRVGGRVTKEATVVAAVPVEHNGDPVEAGKSIKIVPDDTVGVPGTSVRATYVLDDDLGDGDIGDGDGDDGGWN